MKKAIFLSMTVLLIVLTMSSNTFAIAKKNFSYAIIVSDSTNKQPEWNKVVKTLEKKYKNTKVFIYKDSINELVDQVRKYSPDYIAIVAEKKEAGILQNEDDFTIPKLVKEANGFNRKLGNDPYGRAVLGIITGYNAKDALRIAKYSKKLEINFGLGGMLSYMETVPAGIAYYEKADEGANNLWWYKENGRDVEVRWDAPVNHLADMIKLVNNNMVDGIWTSGHASPDNWDVLYNRNDQFLYARSSGTLSGLYYVYEWVIPAPPEIPYQVQKIKAEYPVESSNPKIYLGIGNCLSARIIYSNEKEDVPCYSLNWIHSGGVNQYYGTTVPTSAGVESGWLMGEIFFYRGGLFTTAESAFIAKQIKIFRGLETKKSSLDYEDSWILYGDPAWEVTVPAQSAQKNALYEYKLDKKKQNGRTLWTLSVKFNQDDHSGKEIFVFMPENIQSPEAAGDMSQISGWHAGSNFIIVSFNGYAKAGSEKTFQFTTAK